MKKLWAFNTWEYDIEKNVGEGLKGYGYNVKIYKNGIEAHKAGAFIYESFALSYVRDFIIENEFDIDLERGRE